MRHVKMRNRRSLKSRLWEINSTLRPARLAILISVWPSQCPNFRLRIEFGTTTSVVEQEKLKLFKCRLFNAKTIYQDFHAKIIIESVLLCWFSPSSCCGRKQKTLIAMMFMLCRSSLKQQINGMKLCSFLWFRIISCNDWGIFCVLFTQ